MFESRISIRTQLRECANHLGISLEALLSLSLSEVMALKHQRAQEAIAAYALQRGDSNSA